ncbi:hypothetical protein [Sphingorhabdus sp.]|jgi:hypothetical protein|uniref:hypothetical protein n=2 Tax=Sphingorhabdus sp. TaxID=1902408 RepID=UPI003BAFAA7A
MRNTIFIPATLALANPAVAQETPTPFDNEVKLANEELAKERANDKVDEQVHSGIANGSADRALFAADGPQLEVSATEEDKKGTLSWAFSGGSIDKGAFKSDSFLLQVSTAFDGSVDQKPLFGLKGFANGTDVSLGYTFFWGKIGDPSSDTVQSEDAAAQKKIAIRNCIKRNIGADPKDIAKKCDPDHADFDGSEATFLEEYNPKGFERVYGYHFPEKTIKFGGIKVTGNQAKYAYFDKVAFVENSDTKFGYEATIYGGVLLTESPTSFTGSLTASRKYEANDPITICQPINATQTQCITGPDGAASRNKALIGAFEVRHAFSFGKDNKARLAVAPEISYDIENKAFAVDVPLYLFPDNKGALKGGVRFGYTNTKDALGKRDGDFQLGLFFGVPFSIF